MRTFDMFKATKWIAAVIIAIGVVLSGWHIREFSDDNLGLMIGIGFLIGGIEVLMLGAFASLMQRNTEKKAPIVEPTAEEPVV
ncbi:hypothetical protein [Cohnella fermenti]|uniref:hypothetical protein n=1 Tax=Cohnella fermenti TaxID=2565925 RepID=UPI001B3B2209|nr:hypothetical protein [Cohnella fermenti]